MDPLQIVLYVVVGGIVAVLAVIVLLHVLYAILWFGPHFWLPLDKGGDPEKGLAIWVDPIRFLGGHWGERTSAYGLRKAGFQGQFRYWKWHSWLRGTLVLPAMMDRTFIERKAGELAEFITARRHEHPHAPIYLMGYSAGGFVALRALELLPKDVEVRSAALLSATCDPRRNLSAVLQHVAHKLVISASLLDFMNSGIATMVFGGADRAKTPAMGMCGALQPRGLKPQRHPKIQHIYWTFSMMRHGLLGQHDWGLPWRFFTHYCAPAMGIGAP